MSDYQANYQPNLKTPLVYTTGWGSTDQSLNAGWPWGYGNPTGAIRSIPRKTTENDFQ